MILTAEEINSHFNTLSNWSFENNSLVINFSGRDFIQIIGLVNQIALVSEKADHHPDLFIHGWNKLKISISTHSEGGVTQKDFDLAKKIDQLLNE